MSALASLHGPVALVLLCSLLFMEEAGVPLPLFPGDAILIVGGLLIGQGSLSPWIFIPLACLATFGGFVLAALGAVAYLGIRHIPEAERKHNALRQTRRPFRIALGLLVDAALIATVASGLAEISEEFPRFVDVDGLVAGSVMIAILVLGYIAVTRLGAGGTAGEALLNVTYRQPSPTL
jgi:hypothetical protein